MHAPARKPNRHATTTRLIGVDEVGRGALAGPVVVAAVMLPAFREEERTNTPEDTNNEHNENQRENHNEVATNRLIGIPTLLRDSKQLTARQRTTMAQWILANGHASIAMRSADAIDQINIRMATLAAMAEAVNALLPRCHHDTVQSVSVCADGRDAIDPLLLNTPGGVALTSTAVIKGDQTIREIAAASIVAKVFRDRLMHALHARWEAYGWDRNVGYGTKHHRTAIERHGPTPVHRKSFDPLRSMMQAQTQAQ
ncbi:MAG: ribonuclease HII [Alphaproteobacteria bacterium]|nr:ribonuclease HII [Alphaproteobacteria bacterium]